MGESQFPTIVMDYNTTNPLMNGVGFSRVQVAQSSKLTAPKGTISLVDATFGPIMAIGPRDGFEDLVIGFPLVEYTDTGDLMYNTDWMSGNSTSFPMFVKNMIENLSGRSRFQAMRTSQPGDLVSLRIGLPLPAVQVVGPNRIKATVKKGRDGSYVFSQTESSGIYDVKDPEDGLTEKMFAVNLMDPQESRLEIRDKLEIGFEEIVGQKSRVEVRKEYWTWLALLALVVLMIEWLVYNRRVFI